MHTFKSRDLFILRKKIVFIKNNSNFKKKTRAIKQIFIYAYLLSQYKKKKKKKKRRGWLTMDVTFSRRHKHIIIHITAFKNPLHMKVIQQIK